MPARRPCAYANIGGSSRVDTAGLWNRLSHARLAVASYRMLYMSKQINLRITDELYHAIQERAAADGMTVTSLAIAALNALVTKPSQISSFGPFFPMLHRMADIQAKLLRREDTSKLDIEFLRLYDEWVEQSRQNRIRKSTSGVKPNL